MEIFCSVSLTAFAASTQSNLLDVRRKTGLTLDFFDGLAKLLIVMGELLCLATLSAMEEHMEMIMVLIFMVT